MYVPGNKAYEHHRKTYGPQDKFGYKDFIPLFRAEKFDPAAWVKLFADAGARYVVPVAEHCDGFAMYASDFTRWDSSEMGPKRDVTGEIAKAARAQGMHFGLSSHRAEHWWWYHKGRSFPSDVADPKNRGLYGPAAPTGLPADTPDAWPDSSQLQNWMPPSREFLDDWMGSQFAEGSAMFDMERGKSDALKLTPWQSDTSISIHSWGYAQNDSYRTPQIADRRSDRHRQQDGNLLLNVGPRADGTIPDEIASVLAGMGAWLRVHGEAIYGTRPFHYFGEGPTSSGQVAPSAGRSRNRRKGVRPRRYPVHHEGRHALRHGSWSDPPTAGVLVKTLYAGTPYLPAPIRHIELLGGARSTGSRPRRGLEIRLPADASGGMPYALRVRVK
ncbi:alpha-L-fucosidase domain-containing protein [Ditylenchus destructor]|uniref:alpha-L-fucosidase n=1 Tax=Ditylenchus destructor TaxID=166010 RepID=A0AAD4MEJ8_9BILA|nr:alpha-L-fucosidase domain-containing protein [Ditylenchus destructor]